MRANWSAPLKYFGTNYWSFKICLKVWDFHGKNDSQSFESAFAFLTKRSPGDWQDDIRSSLYTHSWCSYTRTSGLVVKASGNQSQWPWRLGFDTWKSNFWIFEFRFLWYFHMFRGIYTIIWTENSSTTWFNGCRRWIVDREVCSSILWSAELLDWRAIGHPVRWVLSRHARTVDWSPIGTRTMRLSVRHSQSLKTWKWCLREKKQIFGIPHVPAEQDFSFYLLP